MEQRKSYLVAACLHFIFNSHTVHPLGLNFMDCKFMHVQLNFFFSPLLIHNLNKQLLCYKWIQSVYLKCWLKKKCFSAKSASTKYCLKGPNTFKCESSEFTLNEIYTTKGSTLSKPTVHTALTICTTHQHNDYNYSRWFGVTKIQSHQHCTVFPCDLDYTLWTSCFVAGLHANL